MINRPGAFLAALLFLLPSGLTLAQEDPAQDAPSEAVREFLRGWAEHMRDVRTLRVEFVQTKRLRFMRRPVVSQGVALLKGERLLLVVHDAAGEREVELLVEGGEARLHHRRLKRLEIFELRAGEAPPSAFPLFGGDVEALPADYRVSLSEAEEGQRVLLLVPRKKGPLKEFRLQFREFTVTQVQQLNRRGDSILMEIKAFERNPELPEESLRLQIPPGTEIVRPHSAEDSGSNSNRAGDGSSQGEESR